MLHVIEIGAEIQINDARLLLDNSLGYPGYGFVVQRSLFDATLQYAAIAAGAEFRAGRAGEPIVDDHGRVAGFVLSSTSPTSKTRVRADVIIGADGAVLAAWPP